MVSTLSTSPDSERIARARLAAERARKEKWKWQAYAQMLTRNSKLKLEFTGGIPRTDGETIWLRVPIELGDSTPHDKKLCQERDENNLQRCGTCRVLEDVQITMYHEVAHIAFDSFADMSENEKVQLLLDAYRLEANGMPESSRMKKLLKRIERAPRYNFIVASKLISPWFGILLNVAEDGRVNKRMMDARPGTKKMFEAQTFNIFTNGIMQPDGKISRWNEQPKNMQALIAIYCKIFKLDYSAWFEPEVVSDLDDAALDGLVFRLGTARSVANVYKLCIPMLERLRELGYCKTPDDPEDDPAPKPEPAPEPEKSEAGDEADGSGEGDGGNANPDDDESGPDDTNGSEGDGGGTDDTKAPGESPESVDKDDDSGGSGTEDDDSDESDDESGSGAGEDDSDSDDSESDPYTEDNLEADGTPEEAEKGFQQFGRHNEDGEVATGDTDEDGAQIERALVQDEYFDQPSENVWGVKVHRNLEDGMAWEKDRYGSPTPIKIAENILSPALMRLRVVFADNRRSKFVRNLPKGKRINGAVLGRRVPVEDYRIFERKELPGKKDWFVLIGLDVSGSTASGAIHLIKEAAFAKAELCARLGVKFAVYAHTGVYSDHAGSVDLDMYEVKSSKQRWDKDAKARLEALQPASANLDGHTLEFYRKMTERETATDKIILYYTDGKMPLENFTEELEILQREIKIIKRQGVAIVGVGIRNDDPVKHGLDTIRLDRIEDVPKVVKELERRLLQ